MKSVKIHIKRAVRELLIEQAGRCETAAFMQGDPSWFMHQVQGQPSQEVMAFVAASLSYGNRVAFRPKLQHMLDSSQGDPYQWLRSGAFASTVPDDVSRSFYRLHTFHHMHTLLRALQAMLRDYGTMGGYVSLQGCTTAMQAIELLTGYFAQYDTGHLVPVNAKSSCKRLCMFLRWMVRDGSPVDLGIWPFIDKSTLIMPLDTHVLQEARRLGLIKTKAATMSTALRLTEQLRRVFPGDPLKADFALFGSSVQ